MKTLSYLPTTPNTNDWQERHLAALRRPGVREDGVVHLLQGWLSYASGYSFRFNSNIGDDRVLGEEWFAIGVALLGLLNGELGRLDAGTLDAIIRDNLIEQGFDPDLNERKRG